MAKSDFILRMTIKKTLFLFLTLTIGFCLQAQNDYKDGELIIQFKKDFNVSNFSFLSNSLISAELKQETCLFEALNVHKFKFNPTSISHQAICEAIRAHEAVLTVQLNHSVYPREITPNDSLFSEQWALEKVNAPATWDFTTGGKMANGKEIVIAVLDGGYDLDHQDLRDNIWVNQQEIPNDGLDNDGNGYIDDHYGWNAELENDEHRNGNAGLNHGTSVLGIIGAKGDNGLGISGINWNIKMMCVSGLPYESEIIEGYAYVLKMRELYNESNGQEGAFVVATNLSLGIPNALAENHPIWCSMYELLGEQGILSIGATANAPVDIDANGDMPTSCSSNFLITVTSSDQEDNKSLTAAFGKKTIDVAAPGIQIYTTKPNNRYDDFAGTSAAAPLVCGSIGLLYSAPCNKLASQATQIPLETALIVKDFILDGVSKNDDLKEITKAEGRLDLARSLYLLNTYCEPSVGSFNFELSRNPISPEEDIRFKYISSDQENLTRLSLFNAFGQMIYTEDLSPSLFGEKYGKIELNGRLAIGTYFLLAIDGKGRKQTAVLFVH